MQNPERDSKYEANQVWNTDIDADRNRKNSRTALLMLGVTAVLVLALVVAVALYLPNVISYSMDSFDFSLPEFSLSDLLEELRTSEVISIQTEPAPEPDYPPAMKVEDADMAFLDTFEMYLMKLYGAGNKRWQLEVHQNYLPAFEELCMQQYDYEELCESVLWVTDLVRIMGDPETEHIEYLQALYELSVVALTANEGFYFLSDEPALLEYYVNLQGRTAVELEVERDLESQLVGAGTEWSEEYGCEVLRYTNNTPYELDIVVTNDFVTATEQYSDRVLLFGLMPGDVGVISLQALKNVGNQDHVWRINWEIYLIYIDGLPIDDYFNYKK